MQSNLHNRVKKESREIPKGDGGSVQTLSRRQKKSNLSHYRPDKGYVQGMVGGCKKIRSFSGHYLTSYSLLNFGARIVFGRVKPKLRIPPPPTNPPHFPPRPYIRFVYISLALPGKTISFYLTLSLLLTHSHPYTHTFSLFLLSHPFLSARKIN